MTLSPDDSCAVVYKIVARDESDVASRMKLLARGKYINAQNVESEFVFGRMIKVNKVERMGSSLVFYPYELSDYINSVGYPVPNAHYVVPYFDLIVANESDVPVNEIKNLVITDLNNNGGESLYKIDLSNSSCDESGATLESHRTCNYRIVYESSSTPMTGTVEFSILHANSNKLKVTQNYRLDAESDAGKVYVRAVFPMSDKVYSGAEAKKLTFEYFANSNLESQRVLFLYRNVDISGESVFLRVNQEPISSYWTLDTDNTTCNKEGQYLAYDGACIVSYKPLYVGQSSVQRGEFAGILKPDPNFKDLFNSPKASVNGGDFISLPTVLGPFGDNVCHPVVPAVRFNQPVVDIATTRDVVTESFVVSFNAGNLNQYDSNSVAHPFSNFNVTAVPSAASFGSFKLVGGLPTNCTEDLASSGRQVCNLSTTDNAAIVNYELVRDMISPTISEIDFAFDILGINPSWVWYLGHGSLNVVAPTTP